MIDILADLIRLFVRGAREEGEQVGGGGKEGIVRHRRSLRGKAGVAAFSLESTGWWGSAQARRVAIVTADSGEGGLRALWGLALCSL